MKKLLFLTIAIFSILYLTSCGETTARNTTNASTTIKQSSETIGAVTHIKAAGLKDLISKNKTGELIDVRTPKEFQSGAIAGTTYNIDVSNRNFKAEIGKLDRDKTYVIYCRSGARSGRAAKIMESMGFKQLYNLKGGFLSWKNAGN